MTTWQPDWTGLEPSAAAILDANPLAARIGAVTPAGGYVALGLQTSLDQALAAAAKLPGPLTGPLVIAVDTLRIPAGTTVVTAPGVEIVARTVVAEGPATVTVRSGHGPGLELTVGTIDGSLSVAFQDSEGSGLGDPVLLPTPAGPGPTVLTVFAGQPLTSSVDPHVVADVLKSPWSVVALEVSSAVAGMLLDLDEPAATAYAAGMLAWVTAGTGVLIRQREDLPGVDPVGLASLQFTSVRLLTIAQAALSSAHYVPVLAADTYRQEIEALLAIAQVYDSKIAALQAQGTTDQALQQFAQTLTDVYAATEEPLINSLRRLAAEAGAVRIQVQNAAVQLAEVCAALPAEQDALTTAIEDQFQRELVTTAVDVLSSVAQLYLGAGASMAGDPALLAGETGAQLKLALETTEKVIEAGKDGLATAINGGLASTWSSPDGAAETTCGAQAIAASLTEFGAAVDALWSVVATATAHKRIDLSPDLLSALDAAPDISGFSLGGLDPVTYWNVVVANTKEAVQPHADLPQARTYLASVALAATYGVSVADGQLKLLGLYSQGMAAFDRLQEAYHDQDRWTALSTSLQAQEDRLNAATGVLDGGFTNIKRSLVLANQNYRAAFAYQWLTPAQVHLDVTMNLVDLRRAAADSVRGLEQVLVGSGPGVRPAQTFQSVAYRVTGDELFTEVDGFGQAQWSIDLGDATLSAALNGNTAIYLTSATFLLVGMAQDSEVELEVQTSGHYANRLDGRDWRFVSQPVSMTNDYNPGTPPEFVTRWSFADPAAYLKPTPYTDWTMRVDRGNWADVTAIDIVFSGVVLQNH